MSGLRRMTAVDLFHFNAVNLDVFTETFVQHFYHRYLTNWPELCLVVEAFDGAIAGYIIGKVEGKGADWHGHVTAFSVAPEYRHSGVAQQLMRHFEETCEKVFFCFYIDLFVRVSNAVAVNFYRKLGYRVWKTEKGYYSGEEDALDMRKPLPRDINCLCMEFAEEKLLPESAAVSTSRGTHEITGSNDKTATPTTEKSSSSSSSENINSSGKNNNSSKRDNEKINSSGQSNNSSKSDSEKINSSSER